MKLESVLWSSVKVICPKEAEETFSSWESPGLQYASVNVNKGILEASSHLAALSLEVDFGTKTGALALIDFWLDSGGLWDYMFMRWIASETRESNLVLSPLVSSLWRLMLGTISLFIKIVWLPEDEHRYNLFLHTCRSWIISEIRIEIFLCY